MRWIVVALLVAGITVPAALFLLNSDGGAGGGAGGGANGGAIDGNDGDSDPWSAVGGDDFEEPGSGNRGSLGSGSRGSRGASRALDGADVAANGHDVHGNRSSGNRNSGPGGARRGSSGAGNPDAGSSNAGNDSGLSRNANGRGNQGRNAAGNQGRNGTATEPNGTANPEGDPAADIAGGTSVVLRVWAEGEQLDLEGLKILRVPRPTRNAIHPGGSITEHNVFPADVVSPVQLPARRGSFIYWAHAPGFAWASIEIDHTDGGERLLTLTREPVSLQITLDNFYPESDAVLRIHHERARGPGVEFTATETLDLGGLPEGRYFVRVEIGDELWNSVLLGEATLDTTKGQLYPVTIVLEDPPNLEGHVALSGTLELPQEWEASEFAVRVQPLDVPTIQGKPAIVVPVDEMVEANGALRWGVGLVVPGRYRVMVEPLKLCVSATVVEGEPADVTLRVPAPADVSVTVVDSETGAAVDLSRITWVARGQLRGCQPMWENRAVGSPFAFVAPVGEIEISNLFVNDWRVDPSRFQLTAGINDLVVEASPACGIRISLLDGDTPLPLSDLPQSIQILARTTSNRIVSWSSEANWKVARLSGPDAFTVKLGAVRGFRQIADQVVTVPQGEFVDLEIDLVRD